MKTHSQKWQLLFFVAGSLAIALSVGGCGSDNSNNSGSVTTTTTTSTTGTTGPYEQQVLANGPQFYWLLDDSGNQFVDSMSGNNLLYILSDATLEQQAVSSPINNDGNLALNLYSGFVPSEVQQTSPSSFSIELWFQEAPGTIGGQNSSGRIFGFGNKQTTASSQYDRAIYIGDDGYIHFQINNGGVQDLSAGANAGLCQGQQPYPPFNFGTCADGVWHYVVATYDDTVGDMELYVDGNPAASANVTANNISTYNGYWRLGNDNTSSPGASIPFNGSLAQVAIYPGALTQTQVTNDYTAAGH